MSLLVDQDIRTQLIEDVRAAWPDVEDRVFCGRQRIPASNMPYAVIRLGSVTMSGDSNGASLLDVEQTYTWQIGLRDRLPSTDSIDDKKSERANLLINELMSSSRYAEIGYLPIVREVVFDESDDPEEPTMEIMVEFEMKVATRRIVQADG